MLQATKLENLSNPWPLFAGAICPDTSLPSRKRGHELLGTPAHSHRQVRPFAVLSARKRDARLGTERRAHDFWRQCGAAVGQANDQGAGLTLTARVSPTGHSLTALARRVEQGCLLHLGAVVASGFQQAAGAVLCISGNQPRTLPYQGLLSVRVGLHLPGWLLAQVARLHPTPHRLYSDSNSVQSSRLGWPGQVIPTAAHQLPFGSFALLRYTVRSKRRLVFSRV